MGRPNREQVVTTRPDQITTLQALDLTNGPIFADTLARGAANLLKSHPGPDSDKLIESVYRSDALPPPDRRRTDDSPRNGGLASNGGRRGRFSLDHVHAAGVSIDTVTIMQPQPSSFSRRDFLAGMSAAAAATLAAGRPKPLMAAGAEKVEHPKPTADRCILLWMAGGMAAPETFDPKRYTKFEIGVPACAFFAPFRKSTQRSTTSRFPRAWRTSARVMDRATLIRSHRVPDLGTILHSRHQYHWHTGYVPPQTVACPHLGSWIARVRGPNNPVIPPFINIGQRLEGIGESEELKSFTTGGFFGNEFGPFNLPYPTDAIAAVQPPQGMTAQRFAARQRQFRELLRQSPRGNWPTIITMNRCCEPSRMPTGC